MSFMELARRWSERKPLRIEERHGKYYGTRVLDADGYEVITFWSAEGEPSEREKQYFGNWTPARWKDALFDNHWECEADYRAALEFIVLVDALEEFEEPEPAQRIMGAVR